MEKKIEETRASTEMTQSWVRMRVVLLFFLNNFALEGDSFRLKIPIDIQMKSLTPFLRSVLKVWRSALLHQAA